LPELLRQLKLAGYKVVHMVPKERLSTVPKYDEMFDHRENVSSSDVAITHHRGSMYMYVSPQGRSTRTRKRVL
jgi:hypothetical protein